MTKDEALQLIDQHKNGLINPLELLHWTWLRVIVLKIDDEEWRRAVGDAAELSSK